MDKNRLLNIGLITLLLLLIIQNFTRKPESNGPRDDLEIRAETEFTIGEPIVLQLKNNTAEEMKFVDTCPEPAFSIKKYQNGEWQKITAESERCESVTSILPDEIVMANYQNFQRKIFVETGKYRLEIPVMDKTFFHEFEIQNPGFFGKIWRTLVYRPIYNALIFFTKISGYSFGLGIILLTLALRLILFVPFQKSLKSQRKMQKIQPKIEEIKKRFAGNKQMIAMETMALMKKYNVSPLGSCLPILLQMPFLFAVFWVTQDGLGENNFVYFYNFLRNFDFNLVEVNFLGLNLTASGAQFYFVLPITLAAFQFVQMKLALHNKNQPKHKPGENPMQDAMHSMSKMMPYFLPVMIGFFSASMPAAVGIYWGASTFFGILQQLIVNRQIK
jgi:YidC/Oxa1 family membrane protein insertase